MSLVIVLFSMERHFMEQKEIILLCYKEEFYQQGGLVIFNFMFHCFNAFSDGLEKTQLWQRGPGCYLLQVLVALTMGTR